MSNENIDIHSTPPFARDPDSTITAATQPIFLPESALAPGPLPEQIGPFRIIRLIGEGGMGAVFEAEQDRPRRRVALKIIKTGYASPEAIKRFEQEAHILGRLQHPGIAQVYQAGLAQSSGGVQPYFAMELIDGVSLTRYAAAQRLGTRQRLELLARIADAVQHAHAKGVVHRDLKPGNILVTAEGQPKILDFGIARATDSDLQVTTLKTDIGKIVGTLPYMSPEQVTGDPTELDTRSDIYSLGVVLYELLCGRLPHDVTRKATLEAVRAIREDEPTKLASINRALRGDVETIVGRAIEKDKTRRYQTANALAADIRRYLADEPIAARPPSAAYQFRKFARRNKALVAGVAAVMLALAAGVVAASWQAVRARRAELVARQEADRARTQAAKAEQVAAFTQTILASIDPSKSRGLDTQLLRQILDTAAGRIDSELADQPEVAAAIHHTIGRAYGSISVFDAATQHLKLALAERTKRLGPDARETLETRAALAFCLVRDGRIEQAEQASRALLEDRRRILGPNHRDTLVTASTLGDVLARGAKAREAEQLLRETLDTQKQLFGPDDPDVASTMFKLSVCLGRLQRWNESEDLARAVIDIRERTVGHDHTETIIALGNLAMTLKYDGKLDESMATYDDLLCRANRYFGPNHQATLSLRNNYANLLAQLGRQADAEKILREVLDIRRKTIGEDNAESLVTAMGLAEALQAQDRLEDADALARRTLELAERRYGPDSEQALRCLPRHSQIVIARSGRRDALPIMLRMATLERKLHGEQSENCWRELYNWAAITDDLGDKKTSEPAFREVTELWEKHGRKKDLPYVAAAYCSLARRLADRGEFASAEPFFIKSLEMRRRLYPPKDIQITYSLEAYGAACLSAAVPARAEPLFREAVECLRATKPPRPADVAELQSDLGEALTAQKKFAEAESELLAAATVLRDSPKPSNKLKRRAIQRVIDLYEQWDDNLDQDADEKLAPWREALAAVPVEPKAPAANPTPDK